MTLCASARARDSRGQARVTRRVRALRAQQGCDIAVVKRDERAARLRRYIDTME
jgi:hypothetical protein